LAIRVAVHSDFRATFDLLVVGIPLVDNVCGRFAADRVFDNEGISRW
jgi:hypothetical protein